MELAVDFFEMYCTAIYTYIYVIKKLFSISHPTRETSSESYFVISSEHDRLIRSRNAFIRNINKKRSF